MCRPVTCKSCGKTTWAGCGQHVESVMAGVPKPQQCQCKPDPKPQGKGFLSKILGR